MTSFIKACALNINSVCLLPLASETFLSHKKELDFRFIKTFYLFFHIERINDNEVTFQTSLVMTCQ